MTPKRNPIPISCHFPFPHVPRPWQTLLNQKHWVWDPTICVLAIPLGLMLIMKTTALEKDWSLFGGDIWLTAILVGRVKEGWLFYVETLHWIPSVNRVLCAGHLPSAPAYSLCIPDNGFHVLLHCLSLSLLFAVLQKFVEIPCPLLLPFKFFLKLSLFKAVSGRNEYKYLCLIHHFNLIFTILNGILLSWTVLNGILKCKSSHYLHDDLVSLANVLTLQCLQTAFGSPNTECSTHFYYGIPLWMGILTCLFSASGAWESAIFLFSSTLRSGWAEKNIYM